MSNPTSPLTSQAVALRRWVISILVGATILLLSWRVLSLLQLNGLTPIEVAMFALFVVLVLPIALSFWTAVLGFVVEWRGGDPLGLRKAMAAEVDEQAKLPLTAIILPVYNEDPARVMAGLKATYQSLESTGRLSDFEFFILSDTTDPDVWVREELAFVDVRKEVSDPGRIFYRNRRQNLERKTGNIADFCTSWGGRYEYMIVFDADSVMCGKTLVRLVDLMEKNPTLGIIQAPPLPVNRQSLFGRMHQFAMHVYSGVFMAGLNFWQGGAGNYWGHNAIIRIRPFIEHCRLPILPGKPPLGGSILSHDFVEAAFMRRAGWRVYLASDLQGSYEEMPATLLGYASRDRRWCQGNLQHGKLLFAPGLHFVSRVHIWIGMMGYLASPLWLLMLGLTTAQGIRENLIPHAYFHQRALFPTWPVPVAGPALSLFFIVMGFLLLPKVLSVILQLQGSERAARFGGPFKLVASAFLELLLSTLLAPTLALLQSQFVISILLGSTAKWETQDRGDTGTPWSEALRRHWSATALGIAWTVLLALTAPKLLCWFSPVLLGYLLAIPLSVWTSKASVGLRARRHGLFLIPDETNPPQLIQDLQHELDLNENRDWYEAADPVARIIGDPEVRELHLTLLPSASEPEDVLKRHEREGLVLKYRHRGAQALSAKEKRELLLHEDAIQSLARERTPRLQALAE